MDKRKLNWITMAFVVLTVLLVGLMLSHTLRRTSRVVLPEALPPVEENSGEAAENNTLTVVEITTDTVQTAIATLNRLENYTRTVQVELLWSGGSGTYQTTVSARDNLVRMDRAMMDGQTRHTITDGERTYIWYNDEREYVEVPAGVISVDHEQSIPTYEEILALPVESIAQADFRGVAGQRCIYVETTQDKSGYVLRYWVSVESGLLVAAEKLQDDTTVYRMVAMDVSETEPDAALFQLPNGKALL